MPNRCLGREKRGLSRGRRVNLALLLLALVLTPTVFTRAVEKKAAQVATTPAVKLAPGEVLHTFTYRPERGRTPKSVHVAGEFNNWSTEATPMIRGNDGSWTAHVKLPQGTYLYKFVVDGDQWVNDPAADKSLEQDDGHGGMNSGVVIGKDARQLPPPQPNHINLDAVHHDPADPQDVNVVQANRVLFRVRTQADDVQRVELVLRDGSTHQLNRTGSEHRFDVFVGLFETPAADVRYSFNLIDGTAKATVDSEALHVSATPHFVTPDWAKHAVWYQIFPERFRNGDPSNDPGGSQRWQSKWFATLPGEAPGDDNFYQGEGNVWKRRYGGDIQGIREALPYLRKLGINAIYLNPIFEAESMHKYDTTDFRHVDDNFGVKGDLAQIAGETEDPATWKWTKSDRLFLDVVQEARRQGFRVIIDGVFNHVGTAHPFFQDVLKNGNRSKYADWFEITDWGTGGEPGKPGGIQWKAWDNPSGTLPVFKKDAARGLAPGPYAHIMAITRRWLAPDGDASRGVDGFRLDVPGDIPHPFWIEWRKLVKSVNPDAYITGEIWQWAHPWLKGDQFDAVMNYRFAMAAQDFFIDVIDATPPSEFAAQLTRIAYAYPFQVSLVQQNLFDSHDTDRLASMFVNPDRPYDGRNRLQDNGPDYNAAKPSPSHWQRMMQAATFQMTYVGAPMLYYGSEAGMWSPDDPSNRQPMVWKHLEPYDDPQVRFNEQVFETYRRAIAVRNTLEPLRTGAFQTLLADDRGGVVVFARESEIGHVSVIVNRSSREQRITVPVGDAVGDAGLVDWLDPDHTELHLHDAAPTARPMLRILAGARTKTVRSGTCDVTLPPYAIAVLAPANSRSAAGN